MPRCRRGRPSAGGRSGCSPTGPAGACWRRRPAPPGRPARASPGSDLRVHSTAMPGPTARAAATIRRVAVAMPDAYSIRVPAARQTRCSAAAGPSASSSGVPAATTVARGAQAARRGATASRAAAPPPRCSRRRRPRQQRSGCGRRRRRCPSSSVVRSPNGASSRSQASTTSSPISMAGSAWLDQPEAAAGAGYRDVSTITIWRPSIFGICSTLPNSSSSSRTRSSTSQAQVLVDQLAAAEADGHLDLVALLQEAPHAAHLDLVVVLVDRPAAS